MPPKRRRVDEDESANLREVGKGGGQGAVKEESGGTEGKDDDEEEEDEDEDVDRDGDEAVSEVEEEREGGGEVANGE